MANTYTTKTASLKATRADVNNLSTKKIKVNGKDVVTGVKVEDTRERITEHDLWSNAIEVQGNEIIINNQKLSNPNIETESPWRSGITTVFQNGAYDSLGFYCNIETDKIVNGDYMFSNGSKLIEFNSDLSSLESGYRMFYNNTKFESFEAKTPKLQNGSEMFYGCTAFQAFEGVFDELENGDRMFEGCTSLTEVKIRVPKLKTAQRMFANAHLGRGLSLMYQALDCEEMPLLEDGRYMFENCKYLYKINTNFPKLEDGRYMFKNCTELSHFHGDLGSLTKGSQMFAYTNLGSFVGNLDTLTDGTNMFYECGSMKFVSDLSSLNLGSGMFYKTYLDIESLKHIAETIKVHGTSFKETITIGLRYDIDLEEARELLTEITEKGWDVYVHLQATNSDNQVEPELFDPEVGYIAGQDE